MAPASPDLDIADFSPASIAYATQADGRLDTLPLDVDHFILYWNKEMLAAKNVAVPTTFDELYTAAKALDIAAPLCALYATAVEMCGGRPSLDEGEAAARGLAALGARAAWT